MSSIRSALFSLCASAAFFAAVSHVGCTNGVTPDCAEGGPGGDCLATLGDAAFWLDSGDTTPVDAAGDVWTLGTPDAASDAKAETGGPASPEAGGDGATDAAHDSSSSG